MTLRSRPYSFRLLFAAGGFVLAALLTPGAVRASSAGATTVFEGKIP